jgi:hypothetical protein
MPRKGNTNALKHGLYSTHYTETDQAALRKMPFDDIRQEIAALRVVGDKILAKLGEKNVTTDDMTKLSNSFFNAVTAINTSMRTQALLQGVYNPLDDSIDQALKNFDPFEDDEGTE